MGAGGPGVRASRRGRLAAGSRAQHPRLEWMDLPPAHTEKGLSTGMESETFAIMSRRLAGILLSCFILGLPCGRGWCGERSLGAPGERLFKPIPFSQVRLEGDLGARYAAATCNLLTRTDRYSLESFAASASGKPGALWWDWPGDQVGRWDRREDS